jgi:hypothetical protein
VCSPPPTSSANNSARGYPSNRSSPGQRPFTERFAAASRRDRRCPQIRCSASDPRPPGRTEGRRLPSRTPVKWRALTPLPTPNSPSAIRHRRSPSDQHDNPPRPDRRYSTPHQTNHQGRPLSVPNVTRAFQPADRRRGRTPHRPDLTRDGVRRAPAPRSPPQPRAASSASGIGAGHRHDGGGTIGGLLIRRSQVRSLPGAHFRRSRLDHESSWVRTSGGSIVRCPFAGTTSTARMAEESPTALG